MIAILIVSFGILGIVGLQARSIQFTNDAQYRGEAVYLATALLAEMWADDPLTLFSKYNTGGAAQGYLDFKTKVDARLPGASVLAAAPTVTVTIPSAGAPFVGVLAADVVVTVFWRAPGDIGDHNYQTTATIGRN